MPAFVEVALNHQAHDAALACGHLRGHIVRHFNLLGVLFAAVGVRDIHHDLRRNARGLERFAGRIDIGGRVVGLFTATQNDVHILVAARLKNRGLAHLGHAHECVRRFGRHHRIGCHFDTPIGAVFKAHGTRQPTGQLAVALALGGARTNRAPTHQITDELRAEQVQKLGRHWHAPVQNVEQQLAGHRQPLVHGKAAIQMRVVDITLPADGGARFFKIHAHHDVQVLGILVGRRLEQIGIGQGLVVVMNGARAHHHHQPVVEALQHVRDVLPRTLHQRQVRWRGGQLLFQQSRGHDGAHRGNAGVVDAGFVLGRKHGVTR